MSSPTSCLLFPPNSPITWPLSRNPGELPAPHMRLANLALHPTIQDGLPQLPSIAQLECGNFAFSDVTIQCIRGNSQILRRLPHVHHFARFAHRKHYPWRFSTHPNPTALGAP